MAGQKGWFDEKRLTGIFVWKYVPCNRFITKQNDLKNKKLQIEHLLNTTL